MQSKITFNAIKEYRESVEELYNISDRKLCSLRDVTKKTITSDAFQNHFNSLEREDYTDMDKQVLSLITELMSISEQEPLLKSYSESLDRYINVLDKWES